MRREGAVSRLVRATREGRLLQVIGNRIKRRPVANHVRWHGAADQGDAVQALTTWGREMVRDKPGTILLVGSDDGVRRLVMRELSKSGVALAVLSEDELAHYDADTPVAGVLCTAVDVLGQARIARLINAHPQLAFLRFEYVYGLDPAQRRFAQWDEYAETFFVSPVLLQDPNPYSIYAESLHHFEQKCGLRDFLDLFQMLTELIRREVPGDIAEFGSYKGHSGWLIARSLQALGSDKQLWMFDMFEAFPDEQWGVDQFWSSTHAVDFGDVRDKLAAFPNVRLVKGDFTQTLRDSAVQSLALAYIDCDSYRATRYLLDTLPDDYIEPGGLMICEDYGHPALLGNRVAVHEVMDGRKDFARQFSQFSGLYMFTKLTKGTA